jgi:hypothetical protein
MMRETPQLVQFDGAYYIRPPANGPIVIVARPSGEPLFAQEWGAGPLPIAVPDGQTPELVPLS